MTHRYGDAVALDRVDLEVPAGCLFGLIGPDGVGKSSLLALLAGVRRLQTGRVEVLGIDLGTARARATACPRIAYMPQGLGGNLYLSLSVRENVDFFARIFGHGATERRARIAELLVATGLAPFAERPAGKLSGGMKQKLGLCCALIHDPELLILDEPTTGVDPLSRRQFWELIDRIRARSAAMSVVVATAYMEEAERFDQLVMMNAGRILATGSGAALKANAAATTLEEAYVALLPEEKRRDHRTFSIPPRPATDGDPAIETRDLTRRFGAFTAVDRVTFRIERGEIFGFIGSNGCGKTTTMKMLTGLLPASEGEAFLFGRTVDARDIETRRRVGYMSQAFSLYGELTVRQNLNLHARLFHLPADRLVGRIAALESQFDLAGYRDVSAERLPLGIRQRLSLAVAVIHEPEVLILDEPTSGVDPVARDRFWSLLIDLSRHERVTIFISTHFMNEAGRCDRVALMNAGRVLACDTPAALVRARGLPDLEAAFIGYLEDDAGASTPAGEEATELERPRRAAMPLSRRWLGARRLLAYARREALELRRDPVRLTFALLGPMLLMIALGYGISVDIDDVRYAALDRDRTAQSRAYLDRFAGSRYFSRQPALTSIGDLEHRLQVDRITVAIEVPAGLGRDIKRGRRPEVGVWIDGAFPFRAETVRGYVRAVHQHYLDELAERDEVILPEQHPFEIASRYRYNQDFRSDYAIVPGVIAVLLIMVPAILTAVGVVREKELGSITNFRASPVTRVEFLLGKQIPYAVVALASLVTLLALARLLFGVPIKGSIGTLFLAGLLYVVATTGFGLLVSGFVRTQIAAVFATALLTATPAINFSGLLVPVSALTGGAAAMGWTFPTSYFLRTSVGVFTKGLGLRDVQLDLLVLGAFIAVYLLLGAMALRKQEA